MKKKILLNLVLVSIISSIYTVSAQQYVSKVWVSDLNNGNYKNPVLYTDYSDPDACYANGYYYMTASSFNCIPGLPILRSPDMINWEIVGHAIPTKQEPADVFAKPQLGNGVWAPSIRFHKGLFYIYYGDPDFGIYMLTAEKAEGPWSKPVMVKEGKGLIDPCPLWDDDGKVYLAHAYAGSRYGIKSLLAVCELSSDGTKAIAEDVLVFDGHPDNETCEGPKFHKKDGYYYIFFPAGGVAQGWQMVMRSKSVYGPYESKMVMHQGKSPINGPHQGAWVETPFGEDWFFHFQEVDAVGRIVHLQPMQWVNGWPVIGVDKNKTGCGEPVTTYKKPKTDKSYPICTPIESDEFNGNKLGLQWQWYANPKPTWAYFAGDKGYIRLFSDNVTDDVKNLLDIPNLLLQKFPAPDFTATTKLKFSPNPNSKGERCGLVVMGLDYALLSFQQAQEGFTLSQNICKIAERGTPETVNSTVNTKQNEIYLRVNIKDAKICTFYYSLDGKKYTQLSDSFNARQGRWIGAKVGIFCTRTQKSNDGGWIDVDWFRIEK